MTAPQLLYPVIALAELTILLRAGRSRAQNATALRMWLITQLAMFFILEPLSLFDSPSYTKTFLICSLVSHAADLVLLYSVFHCLEDGLPAFGRIRVWGTMTVLCGLVACLLAAVPIPDASSLNVAWMTVEQTFTYIRVLALIALSLYGWLRASSWPGDLAYTWLAMAVYGLAQAIVQRVQFLAGDTGILEYITSVAALVQLAGLWRALSYSPKPLTAEEIDGIIEIPPQEG